MSTEPVKRQYDNSLRAEAALATQRRVLDAAHRLLIEHGYTATSMADIARAAGVSRETLYKSFGSKPALVKRLFDVTLVGDEEPVPLAGRPEFRKVITEPDPRTKLAHYAAVARLLVGRIGPLASVLYAGAGAGDPDLRELTATLDRERLAGAGAVANHLADAGALRPGLPRDRARDLVWTLISPQVWQLLVDVRGWSLAEYEHWLARALADAVLAPADGSDPAAGG
jgi:AcrR family transcriptional regulator